MNAKQLQLEDGTKVAAWCCECGCVWLNEGASGRCCKCNDCGGKLKPGRTGTCEACWKTWSANRETEQLATAEVVEYDGGAIYSGDQYYKTMEDFLDELDGDPPEFVFACTTDHYRLDAGDIIDNMMENVSVEDIDHHDLNGLPEFQAAVAAFNLANATSPEYWEQDSKRKVAVPKPPSLEEMPVVDYSVEDATSKPQAGNGPEGREM